MPYTVFESDKEATYRNFSVDHSWSNATFLTKEAAIQYAKKWFADFYVPELEKMNGSVNITGYGDTGEIRETPE